ELGGNTPIDVNDEGDDIGIPCPTPGAVDHSAVEPALGRENAWRVDENQLGFIEGDDATHLAAGGLRLVRDDGDLGAHQRIEQGRLAGIGGADKGDEATG